MTTFYLVRHASKNVDGGLLTGRADGVDLSEEGRREAEHLARRLDAEPIDRILCSPLDRARATAAPLGRLKGLEVEIWDAFDEIDYGAWTRRHVDDLEPEERWRRYNAFRSGTRIPDGETMHEVQARFVAGMVRLREEHPEGHVAIFSHGDPIKAALTYFAGMPLDFFDRLEVAPASVSVVAVGDYGPRILQLNRL